MKQSVITISRQYGSGGREIGKKLSEVLGIPYYDKDLLYYAAEKTNLHPDIAMDADEKIQPAFLGMFQTGPYISENGMFPANDLPINDRLYLVQSALIKEFAEQGSCVIVGRCADYILEGMENVTNVFIHANYEQRLERVQQRNRISESEAKKLIKKTDKSRAAYYNYYSSNKWGSAENYHLSINSKIGINNCVKLIETYLNLL